MLLWAGLASVMAVWGVCFRLTFWELSWDVMEPVTYFIGSGTGDKGIVVLARCCNTWRLPSAHNQAAWSK